MQYYAIKTKICGEDYYFDHWIFVSEKIDARRAFTKEEAEEHLAFLKSRGDGKNATIVAIDYQPSQEELNKLYEELKSLKDEYAFEKSLDTHDGTLGMLSTQIQNVKETIEELEKLLGGK